MDSSAVVVRWLDTFTTLGRSISDGVTECGDEDGVGDGVGVVQLWKYSQLSASVKKIASILNEYYSLFM